MRVSINPRYIITNIVKNTVVGLMGDSLTSRGSLGLETRQQLILETLQRFGQAFGSSAIELDGQLVYELGPGRSPELMIAMALAGAKRVVGLDIRDWMADNFQQREHLEKITSLLRSEEATCFSHAFGISEQSLQHNLQRFNCVNPICYKLFAGSQIEEEENSIGLLYSKSVLEHIDLDQVKPAIHDQFRVLKPGAVALHIIDLRDHLHIDGDDDVEGDWLDALRYPEWLHRAQTSKRRAYINRLRANDWLKVFENQGFEVVEWRLRHNSLPSNFTQARLSKKFQTADEDFSISWIDALLRKPV